MVNCDQSMNSKKAIILEEKEISKKELIKDISHFIKKRSEEENKKFETTLAQVKKMRDELQSL